MALHGAHKRVKHGPDPQEPRGHLNKCVKMRVVLPSGGSQRGVWYESKPVCEACVFCLVLITLVRRIVRHAPLSQRGL